MVGRPKNPDPNKEKQAASEVISGLFKLDRERRYTLADKHYLVWLGVIDSEEIELL